MAHCKLKTCPYGRDGRCIENLLPNCPNLTASAQDDDPSETSVADRPPVVQTHEPIHAGKKLTTDESAPILQSNPQVIVLGGMVESGKTTLLARVFDMFECGLVTGCQFMGTQTAVEFDKIGWHATMESGGATPGTEHTYRSENNLFFHLRVRDSHGSTLDFLIGDIPGEIFPEAVAEERICRDLQALKRANHVLLFLDGRLLNDRAERHDHCGKVFAFVDRSLQTGQVGQHTILHLVVAKKDLLPVDTASDVMKYLEETERRFRAKFAVRVGGLYLWRIAARPSVGFQPSFDDFNEMIKTWMKRSNAPSKAFIQEPHRSVFSRDFTRFGLPHK